MFERELGLKVYQSTAPKLSISGVRYVGDYPRNEGKVHIKVVQRRYKSKRV